MNVHLTGLQNLFTCYDVKLTKMEFLVSSGASSVEGEFITSALLEKFRSKVYSSRACSH